ncbi:MAG: 3-methylornithyl-N6-L-lysine dehydrogenase PylD [archaeon]|nr:3-methylornithyl-N6-L-lysine dehydrogenase PylD [archaeon]
MTRLTSDDVRPIPRTIKDYDRDLKAKIGKSLIDLAKYLADSQEMDQVIMKSKAAVVPITAGQGIIEGFTEAVASILKYIGMDAFVTQKTDVAGFAEAFSKNVDLLFAGDDSVFSVFNLNKKKIVDNSFATGRAYATALELAIRGLEGKTVLVIGAGRVGLSAIDYLIKKGAKVIVIEIDKEKVAWLKKIYKDHLTIMDTLDEAIKYTRLILIAAPVHGLLDESMIDSKTIVSSPAIPSGLKESALKKLPAKNLIHDPLQIGVVAMAALALK